MMDHCKLRLSVPGKSLAVEMPREDANVWFATLTDALLNTPVEAESESDSEPDEPEESVPDLPESEEPESHAPAQPTVCMDSKEDIPEEPESKQTYHGFLMIRCEHCGEVAGYNSKFENTFHKCRACSGKTDLVDLKLMYARCPACGKLWVYHTNLDDRLAEITCIACGSPITMEQDKYGMYQTIQKED